LVMLGTAESIPEFCGGSDGFEIVSEYIIGGWKKAEHLKIDPTFYDRADAHIQRSNSPLSDISPGKVSASMKSQRPD